VLHAGRCQSPWKSGLHVTDAWLLPAGLIAGVCNAIAGGGSIVTFPVFLWLGYPPLIANVSNAVGIFPSNIGAVVGYRTEIRHGGWRLAAVCAVAIVGSAGGCALLLATGEGPFEAIIPYLIAFSALLVLARPAVARRVNIDGRRRNRALLPGGIVLIGLYAGYFGAAAGVMLLGLLGLLSARSMQELNAFKNAIALCFNLVCVVVFAALADVQWAAAAWMGAGTVLGGFVGAHVARRLSDKLLRGFVVAIGFSAAVVVALQ
jgi:uncharacterized membrane protein YfcA